MTAETAITTTKQTSGAVALAGQVANHYAASGSFADYKDRKAGNTLRAQRADLALWSEYLCVVVESIVADARSTPEDKQTDVQRAALAYDDAGADCPDADKLQTDPASWHGVTWGLVKGFVEWMMIEGYAVGTVNRHLATVRKYCALAAQAGAIDTTQAALIRTVQGYSGKDAKRKDERREKTRKGAKKAQHVMIVEDDDGKVSQATALKRQPDTPQGRRDAVIMALLLDHGLRVGELVLLQVTDFDMKAGTFTFYRPKVDRTQTHRMTADTARALAAWFATDAPAMGSLLRGSRKGGALTGTMSERAVTERVRVLGEAVGLAGLSAHDCRHYWATRAARKGTDPFALRDAGGWSSLAMPSRYVEAAAIANERVKL